MNKIKLGHYPRLGNVVNVLEGEENTRANIELYRPPHSMV